MPWIDWGRTLQPVYRTWQITAKVRLRLLVNLFGLNFELQNANQAHCLFQACDLEL